LADRAPALERLAVEQTGESGLHRRGIVLTNGQGRQANHREKSAETKCAHGVHIDWCLFWGYSLTRWPVIDKQILSAGNGANRFSLAPFPARCHPPCDRLPASVRRNDAIRETELRLFQQPNQLEKGTR